MKQIITWIKGSISLILYGISLLFWGLAPIIFSPIYFLMPTKRIRLFIQANILQHVFTGFMITNRCIMAISTRGLWDVEGTAQLNYNDWSLMISNHQSWVDILVLGKIFNSKIRPLKFFLKKELLWQLPFAGIAAYILGFPFMSRHSHEAIRKNPSLKGKDVLTTKLACQRFRAYPASLLNFVEGTRFTTKKRDRQQSPYQYLLKPRAGGLSVVMSELHGVLNGVINTVIYYPEKRNLSMWDFSCGNFKKIVVRYERLIIPSDLIGDYENDREFRAHFQRWLNSVWQKNDALIAQLKEKYEQ